MLNAPVHMCLHARVARWSSSSDGRRLESVNRRHKHTALIVKVPLCTRASNTLKYKVHMSFHPVSGFTGLVDFIASVQRVKGGRNKCWSPGSLPDRPDGLAVNNGEAVCRADLMLDPASIRSTFSRGLATVSHISSHSHL